jgi:hypothetical protein
MGIWLISGKPEQRKEFRAHKTILRDIHRETQENIKFRSMKVLSRNGNIGGGDGGGPGKEKEQRMQLQISLFTNQETESQKARVAHSRSST